MVLLMTSRQTSENCFREEERNKDREKGCNWKSKQGPYIFLSKHHRRLAREVDGSIEPDHLRCNSLLH